jgi:hypothetical protein
MLTMYLTENEETFEENSFVVKNIATEIVTCEFFLLYGCLQNLKKQVVRFLASSLTVAWNIVCIYDH